MRLEQGGYSRQACTQHILLLKYMYLIDRSTIDVKPWMSPKTHRTHIIAKLL
jgi:hypothetical protein